MFSRYSNRSGPEPGSAASAVAGALQGVAAKACSVHSAASWLFVTSRLQRFDFVTLSAHRLRLLFAYAGCSDTGATSV